MRLMNKSELIVKTYQRMLADGLFNIKDIKLQDIKIAFEACLEKITQSIILGQTVVLRNFGTFGTKIQNAKLGYNPQNGRKFFIGQSNKIFFKPSSHLKKTLNPHKSL